MDEDDVLEFPVERDVDIDLTRTRLRKRSNLDPVIRPVVEKKSRKEDATERIVNAYEFNQEDTDPYMAMEESLESSEEFEEQVREEGGREIIRSAMGIENEDDLLFEAFVLLNRGRVDTFLDSDVIKRKFRPAMILLEKIVDRGVRMKLWSLLWHKNLRVHKLKYFRVKYYCLACERDRLLSYEFYEKDTGCHLGIMGCDCFEVRFQKLIELVGICYILSDLVYSNQFQKRVKKDFEEIFYKINSAEAEMKRLYSHL
jgi:hypothetical protein